MRSKTLVAHIAGLILESRALRRQETQALNHLQELRVRERLVQGKFGKPQIMRILRNSKVAKAPAKEHAKGGFERHGSISDSTTTALHVVLRGENTHLPEQDPAWQEQGDAIFRDLHHYRVIRLRRELRASHLAHGFLLGRGLNDMERTGREPIPLKRIAEIAGDHGELEFRPATFEGWVAEIDRGTHPQPANIEAQIANVEDRLKVATNHPYKSKLELQLALLREKQSRASQ